MAKFEIKSTTDKIKESLDQTTTIQKEELGFKIKGYCEELKHTLNSLHKRVLIFLIYTSKKQILLQFLDLNLKTEN